MKERPKPEQANDAWVTFEGVYHTAYANDVSGEKIPINSEQAKAIMGMLYGGQKDVTFFQNVVTLQHRDYRELLEGLTQPNDSRTHETISLQHERRRLRALFKSEYHLLKVLHTLFPRQIPDILSIKSHDFFSVRERVHGRTFVDKAYVFNDLTGWDIVKKQRLVRQLQLLGLAVDNCFVNFIKRDENDVIAYVDSITLRSNSIVRVANSLRTILTVKRISRLLSQQEYQEGMRHVRKFEQFKRIAGNIPPLRHFAKSLTTKNS
jgi:hypothetical protein